MPPVDVYLVRGLGRESAHWGDFPEKLQALPSVASVTGLDLLGAGKFHKLTSPLSIRENAEFLLSQLDANTHSLKVVISISLGSMVALEMARLQPTLFSKIFVTNTSFSNLSPIHHRLQLAAFRRFLEIGRSKSVEEREGQVLKMVSRNIKKHKVIQQDWAKIAEQRPMSLSNFLRQLVAAATYKIAPQPPSASVVIINSEGDEMVDPSCSQKLAEHWGLPLYTHPSAGHDIFIDDPDWMLDLISVQLKEL